METEEQLIVFKFVAHKCSHLSMILAVLPSVTFGRVSIQIASGNPNDHYLCGFEVPMKIGHCLKILFSTSEKFA